MSSPNESSVTTAIARRFEHLRPHAFTSHRDGVRRYFVHHDMPYPLDCAVLGHRPVWVDLASIRSGYHECARCALRPVLNRSTEHWTSPDRKADPKAFMERALAEGEVSWQPRRAESHLEVSSRYVDRLSVGFRIGNAGSGTPLDAHVVVPRWRGFYAGTSALGNRLAHWRSRRTPGRCESSTYQLDVDSDSIRWQLGASTDGGPREPRWRSGSWSWRDALCGKTRYQREDRDPVDVLVPMPEGDYPAQAKTYRQPTSRPCTGSASPKE